jgi:hypothetical protein
MSPTLGRPICCVGGPGIGGTGGSLGDIMGGGGGIAPGWSFSPVVLKKSRSESRDFDLGSPDGLDGDFDGGDLLCIEGGLPEGLFESGAGDFNEGIFGAGFRPGPGGAARIARAATARCKSRRERQHHA